MAELIRKRYNGVDGVTLAGGGLTNSATSITFSGALQSMGSNIATIGTDEYLPLVIENEIVYLTAYTSGATTGTISRGKEGTTGASHSSGVDVIHGPTVLDYGTAGVDDLLAFNAAFGASTALDYEATDSGTSAPSVFSWVNQGTASVARRLDALILTRPYVSAPNWALLVQTPPTAPYTITAKLNSGFASGANFASSGLVLRDSSGGKFINIGPDIDGAVGIAVKKWNSPTNFSAKPIGPQTQHRSALYVKAVVTSTRFDLYWSPDGVVWDFYFGETIATFLTAINSIGVGMDPENSATGELSLHWWRVR